MQAGTQTYYCQYITHNIDFVFVFIFVSVNYVTLQYLHQFISIKYRCKPAHRHIQYITYNIHSVQLDLQIFCWVVEYWEMKLQILAPNNALCEKEAVNIYPI